MDKVFFRKLAPLLVILAGCMWGSVGFFVRYLSGLNLSNMTIVECRMGGAMFMMVIGLLIYDRNLLKIRLKDAWCFIGTGMLSMALFNFCYNVAINITSLSLAAILLSTAPIFVILLSRVIFKESITRTKLKALILAFAGCVLVSGIFDGGSSSFSWFGVVIGLASGVGYALYSVFSRFALNKGYSSLTINAYSFMFAAIAAAFLTDFNSIGQALSQAPMSLGMFLFFHSLIGSVAPYVLFTFSLKYIDTGRASILASCEPVTATLLGVVIYKEIPSVIAIVGIVLVLVALALLSNPGRKKSGLGDKHKIQCE